MRLAHALVGAAVLCAALVGCSQSGDTTTAPAPASSAPTLPGVDALPVKFDTAAVSARCQGLLQAVDGFKQLGETDTDTILDQLLTDSQASAEWSTTTDTERALTEAAFAQAKTGSC